MIHMISPTNSTAMKAKRKKTNPKKINNVKYSAIRGVRHLYYNDACNVFLHDRTWNTYDGQVVVIQMDEYCASVAVYMLAAVMDPQ